VIGCDWVGVVFNLLGLDILIGLRKSALSSVQAAVYYPHLE
jgi:hypothetical protein